jgi:hypothetical protein
MTLDMGRQIVHTISMVFVGLCRLGAEIYGESTDPVAKRKDDPTKRLTEKELGATLHYLQHGERTEAYRAFYNCSRMKDKTVNGRASELFKKANVAAYVDARRSKDMAASEVTTERIVEALAAIAFTDLPGILSWKDGQMTVEDFDSLSPAQRACIKKAKKVDGLGKEGGYFEIELHDKLSALKLLGTYKQMFVKRHEVSSTGPVRFILNMDKPAHV